MTIITGTIKNIAGGPDNSAWVFYTQLRESADGVSVITPKRVHAYPVAGVLSVNLDPGFAVVSYKGTTYTVTVPSAGPVDIYDLLAAAIAFPPGTSAQDVAAAVTAYLLTSPLNIMDIQGLVAALAGKQPLDTDLSAIAALSSAANKLPYFTGAGTAALTDLTPFVRTVLDDADAAAVRTTLGATAVGDAVYVATDAAAARTAISAQASDTDLTAIAALTSAANKLPYATGAGAWALADLSAAGRALVDDADAAAQRTTLGAVGKGELLLNVKDYGAVGNGSTNDTAAINAAIAALTPGATLYFPVGRYMTNGGHTISQPSVVIRGSSGRAQTYDTSAQLYLRNGANADMLTIAANQVTVRDLSLYGNKTNQTGHTSRGVVTPSTSASNYFLLDAVWVDSFNGDGFAFESSGGTLSSTIVHCESRLNDGYGMKFYGTATDSMVSNCYIDQNVQSGVHCASGDLSLTSCHIWGNGTGGSGDRDGMTFQSAAGCRVINCFIEGNHNGAGIRFKTGANRGHIVLGCDIWDNREQGIYAFSASNCVISDNVIRTNNWGNGSGVIGAGLAVDTCTALIVTGNQFFSVGAGRQTYGYYENGSSNVDIRFVDNMSRAADHTTGGVFLGPGTRADLGSAFRSKPSDQSVTASTTLVDDADLTFAVAVGEVWEIAGVLFVDGTTAGDLTVRLTTPASPSGYWHALGPAASNTSASAANFLPLAQAFNASATVGTVTGSVITVKLEGLVTITTAGTVKLQWAQGTSDATATTLKAGSYLRARRVAQ